jgi:XTP/dITP diphosphohydrolase
LSLVTRHSSLYLASANPGKLCEFREAAGARGLLVEPVPGIHHLPRCTEDAATFEENARKKALHYSAFVEGLVFADDSGISVDALGGAPGVRSARFAAPDADDAQNNQKLLAELRRVEAASGAMEGASGQPRPAGRRPSSHPAARRGLRGARQGAAPTSRAAHYVCVIALAERGRILTTVEGRADGIIVDEPRGSRGFGYDPHFFYPPLGKTFAELTPEEKFAVSHRGAAFRRLLDFLQAKKI